MKATRLDNRLLVKLLTAHRETIDKTEIFQIARVDEQLALLQGNLHAEHLRTRGGEHFGAVRNWIQCKAVNGEDVTWGSQDLVKLRQPLTVSLLEGLACTIASAAVNDFKGRST